MQVTYERFTHLFNACILRAAHTGEHRFGDRRFVKIAHTNPSLCVLAETPHPRLAPTNRGWRPVRAVADWDRAWPRSYPRPDQWHPLACLVPTRFSAGRGGE